MEKADIKSLIAAIDKFNEIEADLAAFDGDKRGIHETYRDARAKLIRTAANSSDALSSLQSRVEELEAGLRPFSNIAGLLFARNCNKNDDIDQVINGHHVCSLKFWTFIDARSLLTKDKDDG